MQQTNLSKWFQPKTSPIPAISSTNKIKNEGIINSSTKKRVREEISLLDDDADILVVRDQEPSISRPRNVNYSIKEKFDSILSSSEPALKRRLQFQQTIFNQPSPRHTFYEEEEEGEDELKVRKEEEGDWNDGELLTVPSPTAAKKMNYTPLELQIVNIRKQFPDCLLMVECGYRMRFFGDDALKAATILGIYAHKDHNFMVASVPTYPTVFHCQRLLTAGQKVAVVRQTETAALRKGNSVSRTFDRKVAGVFTQGTLIDADDPAFEGLIAFFLKKKGVKDDNPDQSDGDEDGDQFEEDAEGGFAADGFDNSFGPADTWVASVYEEKSLISIVAVNICAHKVWISNVSVDSIRQGLMDYLDVLKPVELIYSDDISFETKTRIFQRLDKGSSSSSSSGNKNDDSGYIKLIKLIPSAFFLHHKENFFINQVGTEWYRDVPLSNKRSLNGLYYYLKEFQLSNVFIQPKILIDSGKAEEDTATNKSHVTSCEKEIGGNRIISAESQSFALDGITIRDLEIFDTLGNTNAKLKKAWKDLLASPVLPASNIASSSSSSSFSSTPSTKFKSLQQGLFGIIDNCHSIYGKRTLKNWLMNPLTKRERIVQRQEVISWFLPVQRSADSFAIANKQKQVIYEIIHSCPDIERLLTSLQYSRISFPKLVQLLQFSIKLQGFTAAIFRDLSNSHTATEKGEDEGKIGLMSVHHFQTVPTLLLDWITAVDWVKITQSSKKYLLQLKTPVNPTNTEEEETISPFFTAETERNYLIFQQLRQKKLRLEQLFEEELEKLRNQLKKPALQFTTFRSGTNSQIEHLIELSINEINHNKIIIPTNWLKVNATKHIIRYHPPEILKIQDEYYKLRDESKIYSQEIWKQFILQIYQELYPLLRQSIEILGNLDAILSLAVVASYPNYCKPNYPQQKNDHHDNSNRVDNAGEAFQMKIIEGRHPILEKSLELLSNLSIQMTHQRNLLLKPSTESLIPNDVHLSLQSHPRHCQIITGPNMGGKSSYVRMVGLLVLLGQIGSYIPATSASLCIFENIFTRMGSEDDLSSGRSTFMCELIRMKKILTSINSKSLVIIDELGRGTSTHDGQAIAQATLQYLVKDIGCCTLFITHFPQIATFMQQHFPTACINSHMSYVERKALISMQNDEDSSAEEQDIIFLYKIVDEAAKGSYGVNVARLAGIPKHVLLKAVTMSSWMSHKFQISE